MRKLSYLADHALGYIQRKGSVCPGQDVQPEVKAAFRELVKKGYCWVEDTDDGPRYHEVRALEA